MADSTLIVGFFCLSKSADDHWQNNLNFPQITHLNDVTCKMTTCTVSVGLLSTGLILASATIERFLIVAFPLKFRSFDYGIISKILIGIYYIFALIVSVAFAIVAGISFRRGNADSKKNTRIW